MSARDDILGRIGAAVAGSREIARPATPDDPLAVAGAAQTADRFVERIEDYRAGIDRISVDGIGAAVAASCRRLGLTSLLVPDGTPAGWLADLDPGVRVVRDSPALSAADLDTLDGLLSGCAVAVAETGTIVLDGSTGQGRRAASLVPDVHLCVVMADQLVTSVPQAVTRVWGGRPLTWISGGSATSDIELDRVEGVHGPRTLQVLFAS